MKVNITARCQAFIGSSLYDYEVYKRISLALPLIFVVILDKFELLVEFVLFTSIELFVLLLFIESVLILIVLELFML
jgi:hypothetical protein